METMREKAAQMLRESEVVVLTSVNKEGYPRPVPRHFNSMDVNRKRLREDRGFSQESERRTMLLCTGKQCLHDR